MRANDAICGAMLIAFALAMIGLTLTFPPFPGQKYGPALFPRILGGGLIVCGLILVRRGWAAHAPGAPWLILAGWVREQHRLLAALAIPGAVVVYALTADRIGFVPVAFVLLCALFLLYRVRPPVALATALVATLGIEWFFGYMFRVPLPLGLLPNQPSYALANFLRTLF